MDQYTHEDRFGRKYTWVFSKVGLEAIASELSQYLSMTLADRFAGISATTFKDHDHAWRSLTREIQSAHGANFVGLSALTVDDIDACDTRGRKRRIQCLIADLRVIDEVAPSLFSEAVKKRLQFASRHKQANRPREPFAPEVAAAALERADADVIAARDRIAEGWKLRSTLEIEPISALDNLRLQLMDGIRPTAAQTYRLHKIGETTLPYSRALVPTLEDCVAFVVAIGLRVEMPIESLRSLRRDCLKRSTGKHVWVEYFKGRAGGGGKWKQERVADGGINTPGGLIRLALRLTQPVADYMESIDGAAKVEQLWVGFAGRGNPSWRALDVRYQDFNRAMARWEIRDRNGDAVTHFAPSRMRKTTKAASYRKHGGQLTKVATDHGKGVAARHYAAVDDLAEEHQRAVENAAGRLLASAMQPIILSAAEQARLIPGQDLNGIVLTSEHIAGLTDGQLDTFVGGCLNFWNSPFSKTLGNGCPTPFTACLHCRNAVFTVRKLPGVLALFDWIDEQRSIMGLSEWLEAYGKDRARIELQILPKFTEQEIAEARLSLETDRPLIPVPSHLRLS